MKRRNRTPYCAKTPATADESHLAGDLERSTPKGSIN